MKPKIHWRKQITKGSVGHLRRDGEVMRTECNLSFRTVLPCAHALKERTWPSDRSYHRPENVRRWEMDSVFGNSCFTMTQLITYTSRIKLKLCSLRMHTYVCNKEPNINISIYVFVCVQKREEKRYVYNA